MLFTECKPIGARCIFPCFDEPCFKAIFSTRVAFNGDLVIISNTHGFNALDLIKTPLETQYEKAFQFSPTPVMPTYLICFAIGHLKNVWSRQSKLQGQHGEKSVAVGLHSVKTSFRGNMSEIVNEAVTALRECEKLFGSEYPLPKLDLVILPGAETAENWGCIVLGEWSMRLDKKDTAAKTRETALETLQRTIAHQWIGNLVTVEWWDDLWLVEGLAVWAAFYLMDKRKPDLNYWQHFVAGDPDPDAIEYFQEALDLDSTTGAHPLRNPDASPHRAGTLFDSITCIKGASWFRWLCQKVGTDNFLKVIQSFMGRHRYANATTADLWETLRLPHPHAPSAVNQHLVRACDQAGHSLVSYSVDPQDGSLTLMYLDRCLQLLVLDWRDDGIQWPVSVDGCLSKVFPDKHKDKRPVSGHEGVYRIAHPPSFYQSYDLKKMGAFELIGLVSDTQALACRSAQTDGQPHAPTDWLLTLLLDYLELSETSDDESSINSYFVCRHVFYTLFILNQTFGLSSSRIQKGLARFHEKLLSKDSRWFARLNQHRYSVLSLRYARDNDMGERGSLWVSQMLHLACVLKDASARHPWDDGMREAWELMVQTGNTEANPNIRKYVFRYVVAKEEDAFDAVFQMATSCSPDLQLRAEAFVALGYARGREQISRALHLITSEEPLFNRMEKWFLLRALQTHRTGIEASWEWLKDNWATSLRNKFDDLTLHRFVTACTGGLWTRDQLEQVKHFTDNNIRVSQYYIGQPKSPPLTNLANLQDHFNIVFLQAVERIQAKIGWFERSEKEVEAWLERHEFTSPPSETGGDDTSSNPSSEPMDYSMTTDEADPPAPDFWDEYMERIERD